MKYYSTPQVVGRLRIVDSDGNDFYLADKIVTVAGTKDDGGSFEGTISIDIPDYPKKGSNLVLDVSLPEILAAIGVAAINR